MDRVVIAFPEGKVAAKRSIAQCPCAGIVALLLHDGETQAWSQLVVIELMRYRPLEVEYTEINPFRPSRSATGPAPPQVAPF